MELVLKPSSFGSRDKWDLVIRDHGPVETDYTHIANVGDEMAARLADYCGVHFLYGDPRKKGTDN